MLVHTLVWISLAGSANDASCSDFTETLFSPFWNGVALANSQTGSITPNPLPFSFSIIPGMFLRAAAQRTSLAAICSRGHASKMAGLGRRTPVMCVGPGRALSGWPPWQEGWYARDAQKRAELCISTADTVPGHNTLAYCGVAHDMSWTVGAVFGSFTDDEEATEPYLAEHCTPHLRQRVVEMGANAVIGLRIDSNFFTTTTYGTAVRVEAVSSNSE